MHGSREWLPDAQTDTGRISQKTILRAVQRGDSFVYALVTRQGAIKIGVSTDLYNRKKSIDFGGVEHFLGYMPGTYEDEQALHRSIPAEYRIYGKREYYWPVPEMLPFINVMREWMGVRELRRKALPRLSQCTFTRAVQDREAADRLRRASRPCRPPTQLSATSANSGASPAELHQLGNG